LWSWIGKKLKAKLETPTSKKGTGSQELESQVLPMSTHFDRDQVTKRQSCPACTKIQIEEQNCGRLRLVFMEREVLHISREITIIYKGDDVT
jgi:hypothetical protein